MATLADPGDYSIPVALHSAQHCLRGNAVCNRPAYFIGKLHGKHITTEGTKISGAARIEMASVPAKKSV